MSDAGKNVDCRAGGMNGRIKSVGLAANPEFPTPDSSLTISLALALFISVEGTRLKSPGTRLNRNNYIVVPGPRSKGFVTSH